MSTQHEAQLNRTIGLQMMTLGQSIIATAKYYCELADILETGANGQALPQLQHAPVEAPQTQAPTTFQQPAAAPVATAAPAAAATGRKRRTKAEIEADESAIARGFLNAADELARTGGGAAPSGHTQQAATVPPASVASGPAPVPALPIMQPAVPAVPAPIVTGPTEDDVVAAVNEVIHTVETFNNELWKGHGEGQAGGVLQKLGFQTIPLIPADQRANVIAWCLDFRTKLVAGQLPQGIATAGYIS